MILEGIEGKINFEELKSKLELRFGERASFQNYYSQLSNQKMEIEENYASFGNELERLVRLAYPECSYELRDKIACTQFIAGMTGGFVKRTLQVERIIFLRAEIVSTIEGRKDFLQEKNLRNNDSFRERESEMVVFRIFREFRELGRETKSAEE